MTDEIRSTPAVLVNACVKPDGSVDLIPHSGVVTVTQPIPNSVPADGGFVVTLETGKTYSIPLASVDAEAERVSLWNKCRDLQGSVDAGKAACASLRADRDELWKALERIIDLDHHNMGPESQATKIARTALSQIRSKT